MKTTNKPTNEQKINWLIQQIEADYSTGEVDTKTLEYERELNELQSN